MAHYSAGVEYAIHCMSFLLDEKGESREASVRDLAELQGVPTEYLSKVFTKLAKARLVVSTEGIKGGFRLAKPADKISLLDIAIAVDGRKSIFECRNIRTRCALFCDTPPKWAVQGSCSIHAVMIDAQKQMEETLGRVTLMDIGHRVAVKAPPEFIIQIGDWFGERFNQRRKNDDSSSL